ncbi:TIGR04348 family glycosyltransferase [Pseudoduganella eburnea]|uniref:TIGR04348 family glycosyltransferase n=1 Tax=Massilia eburnea TaxID=1776165 RepID=A0A6L6Q9N8_9BURK|nr:selenoneine biosynthesis selenosugar synthase SenB [Massilia eburnea]MTW09092.1 TIGR04348 family glycosyltransferase [Massilia eburnea]
MSKQTICIASPALAQANNGNWQTARRWAQFLGARFEVEIASDWRDAAPPDLLIALHARRSAAPLARFCADYPRRPTILVLTGTDLYRDIHADADAQASLERARALVLLQPAGLSELPLHLRAKAHVIYQSAPSLQPALHAAAPRHHDILMVGHLREEKDPRTFMQAAALVTAPSARLVHIGGVLDPALGDAAAAAACATAGRYEWLGALPHADTRQRLKHAHAMAICSRMEGGANVIIEAVTSGVPVLASDINGNRGMLGEDYLGYFPQGDAQGLAALIDRSINDPAWYAALQEQCAQRAKLFAPEAEQAALLDLVDNLLHTN